MNHDEDIVIDNIFPTIETPTKIFYQKEDGEPLVLLSCLKKREIKLQIYFQNLFTSSPSVPDKVLVLCNQMYGVMENHFRIMVLNHQILLQRCKAKKIYRFSGKMPICSEREKAYSRLQRSSPKYCSFTQVWMLFKFTNFPFKQVKMNFSVRRMP